MRRVLVLILAVGAASALVPRVVTPRVRADSKTLVIDDKFHHLGDTNTPEWPEAPAVPEGATLDLTFRSPANSSEQVLELRTLNVHDTWRVILNGKRIASLTRNLEWETHRIIVPARAVVNGKNELRIVPTKRSDDILVGEVKLHRTTYRKLLRLAPVVVTVKDGDGRAVPAKLTITDADGALVPVYYAEAEHQATRRGVRLARAHVHAQPARRLVDGGTRGHARRRGRRAGGRDRSQSPHRLRARAEGTPSR